MTPNGSAVSGTQRLVGASWGNTGPYKVDYRCGAQNCSNFVKSSTTEVSHFTYISYATCTGATTNSTVTIWERAGAGASASGKTTTTWSKSSSGVC